MNLHILAGVPGSGKSTWARQFFTSINIVSSDELRTRIFGSLKVAHAPEQKADNNRLLWVTFHDQIEKRLGWGHDVVADATFLTKSSREKVRRIGERMGAEVHLIVFKNVHQADARNAERDADTFVPEGVMKFMFEKYYDTLHDIQNEDYATVTMIESFA